MKIIKTQTESGSVSVPVYSVDEIPYTEIMLESPVSKKRGKNAINYLEIPCAFDIETTNVFQRTSDGKIDSDFRPFAFMYHWQFCIGYRVVFGRTWKEFQRLLDLLIRNMNLREQRIVIYCHNLPFEMQFMRKFLNVTDSFCKSDRNPLKIVHDDAIEFRCSAALSNMSLEMFCKNENARFYKMVNSYDYSKVRTPETILSEIEEGYCYNDVRGLCECIQSLMRFDTLATIPMTSTGYVRREARKSVKQNKANRRIFTDSALSANEYKAMRFAFRGGDTHANARFSNQTLHDVTSYDISSSYPACMMIDKFPMSKFVPIKLTTLARLRRDKPGDFCYLLHVAFYNIKCIATHGMPYIPLAKTRHLTSDRVLDNGRILSASELTIWLTDCDMDIILREYQFDEMKIESVFCSRAEHLPKEYTKVVQEYFERKTKLKGLEDAESVYLYNKSKNKLNALYGMMVMRLDQSMTVYTGEGESGYKTIDDDLQNVLESYYRKRNSFLPYQWGVWVTAYARKRLHQMMDLIGRDLVYVDTDSVKFINADKHIEEIKTLNENLKVDAERRGAFADDRNGKRHHMGVFEHDGTYDDFRTLGAKKYVVSKNEKCYSTIAGVSKKAGQEFFTQNGIDAFKVGAVIKNSGHLVAYYNDDEIHTITINGCEIITASNLALIDDTYTIGITGDYAELLKGIKEGKYHLE